MINPGSSDGFESAAAQQVAVTHPEADLLALRASFNLVRLSTLLVHRLESQVHREAGWSITTPCRFTPGGRTGSWNLAVRNC